MTELEELTVVDAAAWRAWLESHHREPGGVWLVLGKKGVTEPTRLSYEQAVEEAVCFGWIDGQMHSRDASTYAVRFTPRRARSPWSASNTARVARLTGEGRMHPAGLEEVARAKADGRWEAAYLGSAASVVPDDLAAALAADRRAQAMFGTLTRQNRYAILYRIGQAKGDSTRRRRIEHFVAMLARGETVYPQRVRRQSDESP